MYSFQKNHQKKTFPARPPTSPDRLSERRKHISFSFWPYHGVIITSKWRHEVVKLRHSLKYSDYFIMRYEKRFLHWLRKKNLDTNVKVLNYHDVIISSKWPHKAFRFSYSLKYRYYFIMRSLNAVFLHWLRNN